MLWKPPRCSSGMQRTLRSSAQILANRSALTHPKSCLNLASLCHKLYRRESVCSYTSPAANSNASGQPFAFPDLSQQSPEYGLRHLSRSSDRLNIDAWEDLLDLCLPENLASTAITHLDQRSSSETSRGTHVIVDILRKARHYTESDLLRHLGVRQGRWDAVGWVVGALLVNCRHYQPALEPSHQLLQPQFSSKGTALDELCENAVQMERPGAPMVPLDRLFTWDAKRSDRDSEVSLAKASLAQIWQALGDMILHAEDRVNDLEAHQSIMSHVLDILAQMHHIDALPLTIYNYVAADDPSVVQRPPTLYLLSSKIMTLLSDVAWKKHWVSEMARAEQYGYELPLPRVQPQLSQVGTSVWLDLVLWACIEGEWIPEAAWIVSQMHKRSSDVSTKWSVISWEEICKTKAPKLSWTAILKLQLDKARLNQSTGIGIANSGISSVDMGPRRISREAVEAIIDGMVNIFNHLGDCSERANHELLQMLYDCKELIEGSGVGFDTGTLNALVLRFLESRLFELRKCGRSVEKVLELNTVFPRADTPVDQPSVPSEVEETDHSASILGLLHGILYAYSSAGKYSGITKSLESIVNLIDGNRNVYIQEFANALRERLRQRPTQPLQNDQPLSLLYPELPEYLIERLLDSVTANKFSDLGEWLLHNNDVDGGLLRPHIYKSPNIQPALLRYATENADHVVVSRVLEQLQQPLTEDMLHALLRSQVAMNEWAAVADVLEHIKSSKDMNWDASDAMALAAASILRSGPDRGKAKTLLVQVLNGDYDKPRDPSQATDFLQLQRANQIKRILRTAPGSFPRSIPHDGRREAGRLSASYKIPTQAFAILLDAVVERFGCIEGSLLWKQWCPSPYQMHPLKSGSSVLAHSSVHYEGGTVTPSPDLLRIITRPLAGKHGQVDPRAKLGTGANLGARAFEAPTPIIDASSSEDRPKEAPKPVLDALTLEERALLDWARVWYRNLGLGKDEIAQELPGLSAEV